MSNDPKKPFDAPPPETPSLLQKDMDLDRRNRGAPSFEQLRTRPTAPMNGPPAPRQAPPSPTEWAQRQPSAPAVARPAAMPTVTPAPPQAGGAAPRDGAVPSRLSPSRAAAQPAAAQRPAAPRAAPREPPVPVPAPSAPTIESEPLGNIHEIPTRVVRQMPDVPKDLLKTAPGTPGFGQRPVARPAPAMAAPRPAAKPAPPPVDEPVPTSGEYAAAEGDEAAAAAAPEPSPPVAKPAKAARVRPNARAASPEYEVVARPASLFRRLVSWVIDSVVITAVVGGMLAVAVLVISPTGLQAARLALLEKVAMPAAALSVLIAFVYTALFAFLWQGRTFGRRLLGIHLVDGTGSAPGPVRAVIRALLSVVSFALFLAGFWLALFDRKGQTLHDKLSRTFVVRLGADAS